MARANSAERERKELSGTQSERGNCQSGFPADDRLLGADLRWIITGFVASWFPGNFLNKGWFKGTLEANGSD